MIVTNHARAATLLAALALAAGGGSGTSPEGTTQENLNLNVLQLSVGTANIYGTSVGLNVAATYRQPHGALAPGDSAVGVSTPKFVSAAALPSYSGTADGFSSTIESGPASVELGTHVMTGTPQGKTQPSTFGTSGGVFALGIEPFNYGSVNGVPDTIVPYTQPLYDNTPSDPNAFTPWGGPPAFPNQRNASNAGQLGVEEGLDVFAGITPAAGAYTLSATVTPNNAPQVTQSTTSGISNAAALLPIIKPPTPSLDGNGGGSFHASLKGGITEAYVQIVDIGPPSTSSAPVASCNGSSPGGPTYYTVLLRPGSGGSLSDALGPGGSPTLCTVAQNVAANPSGGSTVAGDTFTVQVIGFDYPWFEASPPNRAPAPAIVGTGGQSDISISPQFTCAQAGGSTPILCAQNGTPSSSSRTRHPRV
jgi:hypothetical protein